MVAFIKYGTAQKCPVHQEICRVAADFLTRPPGEDGLRLPQQPLGGLPRALQRVDGLGYTLTARALAQYVGSDFGWYHLGRDLMGAALGACPLRALPSGGTSWHSPIVNPVD